MKDNHTWVICAYGESDYLEACIQSLKNQYETRWRNWQGLE